MSRDMLLYGFTQSERFEALARWAQSVPQLHEIVPDMHRLQLEHWIWNRRHLLKGTVIDIGVENPRRWIGEGYKTLGLYGCDITGDLLNIPLKDESIDNFVLTEVLEHCADPFRAIKEVRRVMKPRGLLLVTSPFIWPDHRTEEYPDYWRFTSQAWELLLKDFSNVVMEPCEWTQEGEHLYDLMRRFECFGMQEYTRATTGYLVEATK